MLKYSLWSSIIGSNSPKLILDYFRNILKLVGSDTTKYYITDEVRDFIVNLQLPEDLECEHCVFQVGTSS